MELLLVLFCQLTRREHNFGKLKWEITKAKCQGILDFKIHCANTDLIPYLKFAHFEYSTLEIIKNNLLNTYMNWILW